MESGRSMRGFGVRVVDSARFLGGDLVAGGAGLETGFKDLTLRCGKARRTVSTAGVFQLQDAPRTGSGLREAKIRSKSSNEAMSEEFESFAAGSENYTDEDVLANFDFDKFLSRDPPAPHHQPDLETFWRRPQSQSSQQSASSNTSTHALPSELRSLALNRLRQIESHIATSASIAAAEAKRRADLENEWLLWWGESPTACFDDSREYFANEAQRTYTEAWERHVQHAASAAVNANVNKQRPYLLDAVQVVPVRPMQQHSPHGEEEAIPRCPNRKSHEDLTACGRSTPIAAQHRLCPHQGCGYCSTSSAGWFEHIRGCGV